MSGTNLAASVRARLRNLATAEGIDFGAVLTRYGLKRMLYRLSISEDRNSFLLKGALLFDVWFDTPTRPTRDIDLLGLGPADDERIARVFREACAAIVDDGMAFDPDSVLTATSARRPDIPVSASRCMAISMAHAFTSKSTSVSVTWSRPSQKR